MERKLKRVNVLQREERKSVFGVACLLWQSRTLSSPPLLLRLSFNSILSVSLHDAFAHVLGLHILEEEASLTANHYC